MKASKSFVGPNLKVLSRKLDPLLIFGPFPCSWPISLQVSFLLNLLLVSCNSDHYFLLCSPIFPSTTRPFLPSLP